MKITLTAKLPSNRINEGSAFDLTANFYSGDSLDVWSLSAPTTIEYRIDRINGRPAQYDTVLDWTTVSPSSSATIAVTGAQNAITTCGNEEPRQITVKANDGLATQKIETYRYFIKNLAAVL